LIDFTPLQRLRGLGFPVLGQNSISWGYPMRYEEFLAMTDVVLILLISQKDYEPFINRIVLGRGFNN